VRPIPRRTAGADRGVEFPSVGGARGTGQRRSQCRSRSSVHRRAVYAALPFPLADRRSRPRQRRVSDDDAVDRRSRLTRRCSSRSVVPAASFRDLDATPPALQAIASCTSSGYRRAGVGLCRLRIPVVFGRGDYCTLGSGIGCQRRAARDVVRPRVAAVLVGADIAPTKPCAGRRFQPLRGPPPGLGRESTSAVV